MEIELTKFRKYFDISKWKKKMNIVCKLLGYDKVRKSCEYVYIYYATGQTFKTNYLQ